MPTSREVNIPVVEDDEIDVMALLRAFKKLKIANPVTVAKDGIEGWEAIQALPRPYLLILDINMPRIRRSIEQVRGDVRVKTPKTKKSHRRVTLPKSTVTELQRHSFLQKKEKLRLGPLYSNDGWVFSSANGAI